MMLLPANSNIASQLKFAPKTRTRSRKTLIPSSASISILLILTLNSIVAIISASSATSPNTPNVAVVNQTSSLSSSGKSAMGADADNSKTTNISSSKTTPTGNNFQQHQQQHQVTIVEPQQQQSTDISSMYVQIPIAEPGDTGVPDGVQQTLSSQDDLSDPSAGQSDKKGSSASTWTGPWPKKFQIGYIKQSDLHQVLIESLKNDPFVSLSSPSQSSSSRASTSSLPSSASSAPTSPAPTSSTLPVAATKTSLPTTKSTSVAPPLPPTSSSDSSSLMAPSLSGHKLAQTQWPSTSSYGPAIHSQRLQHPQQVMKNTYHQHRNNQHNQNYNHQQQQPILNNFNQQQKLLQQSAFQQQMQRYQQQQQLANFNHAPRQQRQLQQQQQQQQQQKLISMTGNQPDSYQQQQFQFAGFPTGMFKNQPIYTINNYPPSQQQEQLDANSMQLLLNNNPQQQQQQQIQFPAPMSPATSNFMSTTGSGRHQKSADYYSSWKPVTNDDKQQEVIVNGKTIGQVQSADYQNINDDFEDGFSSPSKDAASTPSSGAMNRHPMLNNYLGSSSSSSSSKAEQSAKLSPVMKMKQREQEGTKTSTTSGGTAAATKGSGDSATASAGTKSASPSSTKGSSDSSLSSSGRRRASNNGGPTASSSSTTSTTTSSSSTDSPQTTTTTSSTSSDDFNNSTTIAPVTTSSSTMIISTTTIDTETAEPDSEVIESDTTEPSSASGGSTGAAGAATTTTTPSSTTRSSQESGSATTTADDGQQADGNREAEVATQSNVQQLTGTAKLPSLSQTGNEDSAASSTQASNTREETTPSGGGLATDSSNATGSLAASKGGETEMDNGSKGSKQDSMSDEALLAAVRNSADIGKMQQQRQLQQNSAVASSKRIRSSSERLQAQQTTGQEPVSSTTTTTTLPSAQRTGRKSAPNNPSNKLITKKPSASTSSSSRSAKQVAIDSSSGVKGASSKLNAAQQQNQTSRTSSGSSSSKSNKKRLAPKAAKTSIASPSSSSSAANKLARPLQSNKLQAQPQPTQVLSMTAAQAQSTAQTLASLLLSRCLAWNGCAHLLDICTTKQAAVPMPANLSSNQQLAEIGSGGNSTNADMATTNRSNSTASGWSVPVGLMSSGLMSLAQALQADRVLKVFPQWKDAVENVVDHDPQTGYTLILPSNEAIDRLPMATVDSWLANSELMGQIIDNHMIDSAAELIEFGSNGASSTSTSSSSASAQNDQRQQFGAGRSRVIRSKGLQVNQHRDRMVTINGKRLVYANQLAPAGGRIHVIDGVLDLSAAGNGPGFQQQANKLLDIMDTLKQCDKFDGFVTLAEGTGLTQILKQDGPMTVFVPSNEALRKIPDEELEVIKNNSTALKEFLMYHVVNGSYFSQDLRDGQQLSSILDMKPIQVGIRVDGCSRRLVEANTSPMRRPDIVAKNGVIHILDWYLTVRDNEWCDQGSRQAILDSSSGSSMASSSSPSAASGSSSDRLQQLASDSNAAAYATRMSMPSNHKPAPTTTLAMIQHSSLINNSNNNKLMEASQVGSAGYELPAANNIIVSASPLAAA